MSKVLFRGTPPPPYELRTNAGCNKAGCNKSLLRALLLTCMSVSPCAVCSVLLGNFIVISPWLSHGWTSLDEESARFIKSVDIRQKNSLCLCSAVWKPLRLRREARWLPPTASHTLFLHLYRHLHAVGISSLTNLVSASSQQRFNRVLCDFVCWQSCA